MAFGWMRVPGSARRFQNAGSGEVISYRQYDKLVKQMGEHVYKPGPRAASEAGTRKQYQATLRMYQDMRTREGRPIGTKEARQSEEFQSLYRGVAARSKRKSTREKQRAKRETLLDYLSRGSNKSFQDYYNSTGSIDAAPASIKPMNFDDYAERAARLKERAARKKKRKAPAKAPAKKRTASRGASKPRTKRGH